MLDQPSDPDFLLSGEASQARSGAKTGWRFRKPRASDGPAVTVLVAACPPLDRNSRYCTLVQCTHFADCCIVAECDGWVAGWVSGHRLPSDPHALFVWQIAVAPHARGMGLAGRMIDALLARQAQQGVTHVIASVTEDNVASWRLFCRLAREWGTTFECDVLFERETHFAGTHPTEYQVCIGPLADSLAHRPDHGASL